MRIPNYFRPAPALARRRPFSASCRLAPCAQRSFDRTKLSTARLDHLLPRPACSFPPPKSARKSQSARPAAANSRTRPRARVHLGVLASLRALLGLRCKPSPCYPLWAWQSLTALWARELRVLAHRKLTSSRLALQLSTQCHPARPTQREPARGEPFARMPLIPPS